MTKSYVLALTGSAQQLSAVYAGTPYAAAENEPSYNFLSLQADTGNAAIIKVGSDSGVATTYGYRIEAPTATVPPAPNQYENVKDQLLKLSDIWVIGTNGDDIRIHGIPNL